MTAPIIPADLWPEGTDRHCWDAGGQGYFYWLAIAGSRVWLPRTHSSVNPMPAGWDWRVPVMRSQPAPAIDMEQYGVAIQYAINGLRESGCRTDSVVVQKLERLLALIDGQAGGQSHPDTDRFNFIEGECLAVEAVSVRASEDDADVAWVISQHHMGRGQLVLHRSHDDNLRRAIDAVMQPAKGEGE